MGRIVISENVSLDGVVQDPTGDEGFERGGWFARIGDEDRAKWATVEFDEALRADARRTAADGPPGRARRGRPDLRRDQ
jgi:hypothetical protein